MHKLSALLLFLYCIIAFACNTKEKKPDYSKEYIHPLKPPSKIVLPNNFSKYLEEMTSLKNSRYGYKITSIDSSFYVTILDNIHGIIYGININDTSKIEKIVISPSHCVYKW